MAELRQSILGAIQNLARQIDIVTGAAQQQLVIDRQESARVHANIPDFPELQTHYSTIIRDAAERIAYLLDELQAIT